jgi:predicted nucleic acid-binding protein
LQQIRKLIANFEVVWATAETCNQALEVFTEYNLSHGLGLIDALIGQTSISLGLSLRKDSGENRNEGKRRRINQSLAEKI